MRISLASVNLSLCLPKSVDIDKRYEFVCQFFIAGRNKMHFMALLPMSAMYETAFLSSRINYDAYLAKGPLQC